MNFSDIDWKTLVVGGLLVGIPFSIFANIITPKLVSWSGVSKGYVFTGWKKLELRNYREACKFRDSKKDPVLHVIYFATLLSVTTTMLTAMVVILFSVKPVSILGRDDIIPRNHLTESAVAIFIMMGFPVVTVGLMILKNFVYRFQYFEEYEKALKAKYGDDLNV